MRHVTNTRTMPRFPVASLVTGALLAGALLSSTAMAQGEPPRPPRVRMPSDSLVERRPARTPMPPQRVESGAMERRAIIERRAPGRGAMGPATPERRAIERRAMDGAAGRGAGRDALGGRAGGSSASALLRQRDRLNLTDDQVRRLERLAAAPVRSRDASEQLRARADLMDATRGDGDIERARAAMDRMNRLRTEQTLAGLRARQEARNVLSAEQRRQVEQMRVGIGNELRGRSRDQMRGRVRGDVRERARVRANERARVEMRQGLRGGARQRMAAPPQRGFAPGMMPGRAMQPPRPMPSVRPMRPLRSVPPAPPMPRVRRGY